MLNTLRNALLVPEIRKRVGFVFFAFAVFVFMIHVQLPNVDQAKWQSVIASGAFYQFLGFLSGGALQKLSIIAMGITPYINASIIMQLMTVVIPQLEEMAKKGGEEGRKTISRYTRWLTIVLAFVQAFSMSVAMSRSGVFYDSSWTFIAYAALSFVSGTIFLMWLGEQITDKGIGNGISLIIFVGIVLRFPSQIAPDVLARQQGQRQLPRPRAVAGDRADHDRLDRVHVPGPAPYPGAASAPRRRPQDVRRPLELHSAAAQQRRRHLDHLRDLDSAACRSRRSRGSAPAAAPGSRPTIATDMQLYFGPTSFLYNLVYFLLVVIFTFFYSSIVVNTKDIADNLKKSGSFIPGIRPGEPTVQYINKILFRITTAAAVYLGLLAVLPSLQQNTGITQLYIGSTSLLIVVGVALDSITQIEARLAMRDYRGFIKK